MFWRQEGNWCWFCRTPYFPFDLVPSCESPAGEITSATLELEPMTEGWTLVLQSSLPLFPLGADVHDLDQQLDYTQSCQQRSHLYSPEVWLGRSYPRSQRSVGRRKSEVRGCKNQGKAAMETGNPFSVVNNGIKVDCCKCTTVVSYHTQTVFYTQWNVRTCPRLS